MMTRTALAATSALTVLAAAGAANAQATTAPAAPAQTAADPACAALMNLRLNHTRIDAALAMKAGDRQPIDAFGVPALPTAAPYCRVSLTLTPVTGSEIHSEVWLPVADNWNGKFAAMGNAGFGGSLGPPRLSMRPAVARGYAVAASDMGHTEPGADGKDASWALNQPERIIDFGHRANHVTAVAAKAVIAAYYGQAPRRSYFQGCSDGGREALMAAQRYPDDFDGIVAGAPGAAWTHLMTSFAWSWKVAHQDPASRLKAANLTRIQTAVLEACDTLDGVKDGVIEDPRICRFDPASLLCDRDAAEGCLTAGQVAAVQGLYGGPRRGVTGAALYPGFAPGGEAQRSGRDLWITRDAALPAEGTIQYFETVRETMGADEVDQFARLFMVPAMGHCFGGPGPNAFDSLAVLDAWVESGSAPDRIIASKYANDLAPLLNMPTGPALSTRPLCAYPAVARWKGEGSTTDEANFVCVVPPKTDI